MFIQTKAEGPQVRPIENVDQNAVLNALKNGRPTDELAEGMTPLDSGTQGLIEKKMAQGLGLLGSEVPQRMEGVGKGYGLLNEATHSNSMGIATPDDFESSINARGRDAVADTAQKINANEQFMEPVRQAKLAGQASANFAKTENLRFNNWVLKNQQALQKYQLEAAKEAAKKSFLSSILGLGGFVVGGGIGAFAGGPMGAAAGAGAGMSLGAAAGQVAG